MIVKRKNFSGTGEVIINGVKYVPAQVTDTLHDTIGYTEDALGQIDKSAIGQTTPVKKKTRMAKNVISGIKGFMPRRKKIKKENNHV